MRAQWLSELALVCEWENTLLYVYVAATNSFDYLRRGGSS